MKVHVTSYQFDAAGKKVTFPGYTTITLDQILLITNVTDGRIIYNFCDPSAGGTVAGNVLTLAFDTTAMSNSDNLLIYFDDTDKPATDAILQELRDQTLLLQRLLTNQTPLGQLCNSGFTNGNNSSPYRLNVLADVPQLPLAQQWQYSDLGRIGAATAIRQILS